MVCKFFDEKKKQKVAGIESNNELNQKLRKVCLSFEDNI